jgi:hypothetical protein
MSLAAMHPGRCFRCHGRIEPGDEIDYFPASHGAPAEVRHVDCPESAPAPASGARKLRATLAFDEVTCSGCGGFFARRRDRGGIPDGAPSPCCGEPLRLELEDG